MLKIMKTDKKKAKQIKKLQELNQLWKSSIGGFNISQSMELIYC